MRKVVHVALLVVVLTLLTISAASAQSTGGGFGGDSGVGQGEQVEVENTPADTVYVRENGDAVLVYESSESTSNGSVSYGAEMSSGLMHFLAEGTAEDTEFTGDMSFVAEPTSWTANGSFQTGEVQSIQDFSLDASGATDQTNSEFSAELDSTLSSQFAALVSSASTEGEIVTGPNSLTSSGSASYEMALGSSSTREVRRFSLSGTDGGYVLDARERKIVRSQPSMGTGGQFEQTDPAEQWGTRERAVETLRENYASFAENTSGTAEVTLESYSFEEVEVQSGFGTATNESLVDVEYTVEYTGVTDGLADGIVEMYPSVSQETADEMAQGIRDAELNSLSFSTVSDGGSTNLNWTVDVENYNDATLAYLRLSTEMPTTGMGTGPGMGTGTQSSFFSQDFIDDMIERSEQQMAAAEAANYVSRWEWSGGLESGSGSGMGTGTGSGASMGGTASVTAEMTHTTENWESYVNELESRDLPTPVDTNFDLQVSSANGGLEGDMSWEASGESLYQGYSETMDAYESMLENTEEIDADLIRHLSSSGFRIAKMDASVGEDGWSLEAGAAFDNGTALASAIESTEDIRVTEVVGQQENGGVASYVKVSGFVDETTEDAVRSRDQVGGETTVNMPGDWDRDFPEMDRQAAADYLGVEVEGRDEGGSPLPGFGFVVALVALTVAAVVVGRRRD